jgi:hypothetical protein
MQKANYPPGMLRASTRIRGALSGCFLYRHSGMRPLAQARNP